MLCLQGSACSAESSTDNQSSKCKQKQLGVWLSLSPPRNHTCPLCSRSFRSLQAVGGHQNAHRDLRIAMHKMHMKVLEDKKLREAREGKCIHSLISPVRAIAPPPTKNASNTEPMANDPTQIDLDLRLSSGPPNKVMTFYELLPIKKGKRFGVGAPSGSGVKKTCADKTHPCPNPVAYGQSLLFRELAEMPVRAGTNAGGFGCGAGFLEASIASDEPPLADPYVGWLPGRRGTMKVTSKTGLDVTLKL